MKSEKGKMQLNYYFMWGFKESGIQNSNNSLGCMFNASERLFMLRSAMFLSPLSTIPT